MQSTRLISSFGLTLLFTFAHLKVQASTDSATALWSYDGEYGPDKWSNLYPACGLQRQSPINIDTSATKFDDKLDPLLLSRTDTTRGYISDDYNNGFTVNLLQISPTLRVTGGKLGSSFRVATVHFHWGPSENIGSEHAINSKRYPLEMHVVCYDEVKFDSLSAAAESPKGLAVIGRFFQVSEEDNNQLKPVVDLLPSVRFPNVHVNLTGFDVTTLLPPTLDDYYRYDGSLTTPPCFETVTWTVLASVGTVSRSQLEGFRRLQEQHHENIPIEDEMLTFNWRPVQPLNQRSVYRSFSRMPSDGTVVAGNSAAPAVANIWRILFVAFCLFKFLALELLRTVPILNF